MLTKSAAVPFFVRRGSVRQPTANGTQSGMDGAKLNHAKAVANVFAYASLCPSSLLVCDGDTVIWANRAFESLSQMTEQRLAGLSLSGLFEPDLPPGSALRQTHSGHTLLTAAGNRVPVSVTTAPTGVDGGHVVELTPATGGHQTRADRFWLLADIAPVGIVLSEVGERLQYANNRVGEILCTPTSRLLGLGWKDFVADEDVCTVNAGVLATVMGQTAVMDITMYDALGSAHNVQLTLAGTSNRDGASNFVGTLVDRTDALVSERRLLWESTHDKLTRIGNRAAWDAAVDAAIGSGERWSMFLLDLDGFKPANDTYGHAAGDAVLTEVASRLVSRLGPRCTPYRIGGDEFAVLSFGPVPMEQMRSWVDIKQCFEQPIVLGPLEIQIGASIGYARWSPGDKKELTFSKADADMYAHKNRRKDSR